MTGKTIWVQYADMPGFDRPINTDGIIEINQNSSGARIIFDELFGGTSTHVYLDVVQSKAEVEDLIANSILSSGEPISTEEYAKHGITLH